MTVKPLSSPRKLQLAVEQLESRLNLSGMKSAALLHDVEAARLAVVQTATYGTLKPQSLNMADITSLFGDTTVSGTTATVVPVTDYSLLSGAQIEYRDGVTPNIGYMSTAGATIEYKLNVAAAGTYKLAFSVAAMRWGSFDLLVNGSTAAQYAFNATGGWSNWTGTTQTVTLSAGTNTVQIKPTWESQFNVSSIVLTPTNPITAVSPAPSPAPAPDPSPAPALSPAPSTPVAGNAITVGASTSITADKYSDIWNSRVEYAYSQVNIGYVSTSGAYVDYSLNVQTAGNYRIEANAASTGWATFDLLANGSQAANYVVNSTGSWGDFQPVSNTVYLAAGANTLRFQAKWGTQYNLGTIKLTLADSITTPATPTTPTPPPPTTQTPAAPPADTGGPVAISTSWMTSFHQLNVIASAGNDSIYVSQAGDTLYVNANGNTTTYTASSYGDLLIKGGDGNDNITIDSSVKIDARIYGEGGNDTLKNATQGHGTIVAIGGGWDTLSGNGWSTSFWADSSDQVNASSSEWNGRVHQVSGFWGGVSTELLGQNLTDPSGTGSTVRLTSNSLWGTGPTMGDVAQGQVSDCYLLGPLQTMAYTAPDRLREVAVDLGDGTYAVQFKRGGKIAYVRVDGDLPAGGYYANGLNYAHLGASGNQWMPILEKAYAEFRTGAWSYPSLTWGNFNVVLSDFGQSYTAITGSDANARFNSIQNALAASKGVTIGTLAAVYSGAPLVASHTYTVTSAWRDASGVGYLTLRNPWGMDGAGNDGNSWDALVTLSMYQLQSNYQAGSILV